MGAFHAAVRQIRIVGKPPVSTGVITDSGSSATSYLTEIGASITTEQGPRVVLMIPKDKEKLPVSEQNTDGVKLTGTPVVVAPQQGTVSAAGLFATQPCSTLLLSTGANSLC